MATKKTSKKAAPKALKPRLRFRKGEGRCYCCGGSGKVWKPGKSGAEFTDDEILQLPIYAEIKAEMDKGGMGHMTMRAMRKVIDALREPVDPKHPRLVKGLTL